MCVCMYVYLYTYEVHVSSLRNHGGFEALLCVPRPPPELETDAKPSSAKPWPSTET